MFKVLTFFSIIIIIIFTLSNACGSLAQPVEHRTVNPSVAGSSPAGAAQSLLRNEKAFFSFVLCITTVSL